jgi:serine/alanine racemase
MNILAERNTMHKSDGKYDVIKFVLSLFVVAIHTRLFPSVLYPWLRIAVPMFFMMTSYFFFGKVNAVSTRREKINVLKNFVKRNLSLYVFWLFLFIPRLYNGREVLTENIFKGILLLVKSFLFGSTFAASWYIMASVIGVLIIFVLSKRLSNKALLLISVIIYFFVVVCSNYKFACGKDSFVYYIITWYSRLFISPVYSFSAAMVWVPCGKCFVEKTFDFSRKTYIIISVLFAVALYGEWLFIKYKTNDMNNDFYFFLLPFCFGLFGWIKSLPSVFFKKSIYLRRCSTFMYVSHSMAIKICYYIFNGVLGWYHPVVAFVFAVLVCSSCYLGVEWLLNKYPDNKFIQLLRYSY